MQSSSAQVTVMESQDRKRAPAWTEREVRDLLAIWGDEAVIAELRSSKRNGKVLEKISKAMKDRGHNRDTQQCRVKIKELRQAYHKAREANGRSGAEPQTCRYYAELHAILGGAATTTPTVCYDSLTGETHREDGSGNEEDEDGGTVGSSQQQGSGETGFPNSQDMFVTLDLEPVTPELTQDPQGTQETSAANVSPSQMLVNIRKRKRRTRDDMFTELQMSSHADRAQQNAWRQSMSEMRKAQYEREERWRANGGMKRASGGLKTIGGVSLQTDGKSQCSVCWSIKLICSSVWLSCRKGSRSRDHRYSPCVTNSPPPKVP
ncbi:myb/SANT-like DNA-binding domain-containing protein 2 [Chrysemys picta bellii]|uniref:myb/SANT-like DNA-binding domain-containing protein 2 n=2 Tax=Chrysemys picta bellii TaxID=8478 RepID=UPI0032B25880